MIETYYFTQMKANRKIRNWLMQKTAKKNLQGGGIFIIVYRGYYNYYYDGNENLHYYILRIPFSTIIALALYINKDIHTLAFSLLPTFSQKTFSPCPRNPQTAKTKSRT